MPYKSEAQRKFFNVNRKKLESKGVDVNEWNQTSKGKKLPEKKANTPGQTGNIPATPPTSVRPEAAPSANIPRPARRQTTLADMRGKQAMSTQKVDTPFFYLLGDLAKAAARVKVARLAELSSAAKPSVEKTTPAAVDTAKSEPQQTQPFKGGPGLNGLGRFPAAKPSLLSQLGQFATSPMGLGAGLGLTSGAVGAYLGSRRRKDEDEKEASVKAVATAAAKSRIKQAADPTLSDKLTHYAGIPAALLGAGALTGTGVGALAHPIQELFSGDNDPEARKRRWRERLLTGAGVGTGVGIAQTLRHLSSPVQQY